MNGFDPLTFLLAIGLLLLAGRLLGELAGRLRQPPVLGEIIAGIVLGPTIFGRFAPDAFEALFPAEGPAAHARGGLATFAVVMFMFVAGMEVDLSTIWRRGRAAIAVSITGIVVPFGLGLAAALLFPATLGREPGPSDLVFTLFFATALSISALPVIARTLMDLNLYRSDVGMVVIAAAVFNDLVGWIVFALILGLVGDVGHSPWMTIGWVVGFSALMLTLGRWLLHRSLPFIQAHLSWPAGVMGFALTLALFGAAITEWIGVHALFGAFLAGVALGDSTHLRERTRSSINQFVSSGLAPLFFTTIGLSVDFVAHFDLPLTLLVLVIACIGKVLGCAWGARRAGMERRESWAVGFGMNARGAMEIILGLIALRAGIIGETLFVSLVVMALVTSMMSGPIMSRVLRRPRVRRLVDFMTPAGFRSPLVATTRDAAIRELCAALAAQARLPAARLERAVLEREALQSTGLGNGVAVPHARMRELTGGALLAVGLSERGLDFDAPDGAPAHVVFLAITPHDDAGVQLDLLADIGRIFSDAEIRDRALAVRSFVELQALLKIEGGGGHG